MTDLDFDELDRAVNSILGARQKVPSTPPTKKLPESPAEEEPEETSAPPAAEPAATSDDAQNITVKSTPAPTQPVAQDDQDADEHDAPEIADEEPAPAPIVRGAYIPPSAEDLAADTPVNDMPSHDDSDDSDDEDDDPEDESTSEVPVAVTRRVIAPVSPEFIAEHGGNSRAEHDDDDDAADDRDDDETPAEPEQQLDHEEHMRRLAEVESESAPMPAEDMHDDDHDDHNDRKGHHSPASAPHHDDKHEASEDIETPDDSEVPAPAEPDEQKPEQPTTPVVAAARPAPVARRGRFMDVVHPSADMNKAPKPIAAVAKPRVAVAAAPAPDITPAPTPKVVAPGPEVAPKPKPISREDKELNDFHEDWDDETMAVEKRSQGLEMPKIDDDDVLDLGDSQRMKDDLVTNNDDEVDAELDKIMQETYNHEEPAPSPFLPDVKVEKRPLGQAGSVAHAAAAVEKTPDTHVVAPGKEDTSATVKAHKHEPVVDKHFTEAPSSVEQTSGNKRPLKIERTRKRPVWMWVIVCIILLLLGIALGAVLFLYLNGTQ